ncbi:baseplate J/gp47 family protein [Lactobacillus gasseri]|uniref:baseplate J/gp47 family protein n=1 Tax=Lactobacillus paragasseri TaxID=2107999 RepID=UPI0016458AA4|nr:baseplate J/gp47 family protein [Lactobacillus paragasseri]MBS5222889.1 baseplate J/gp47 family protein [Lactobacillus gasseri]MBO3729613.1 baseplate J/gp47 family protein [Lactobacillus paragasseri]MCZ3537239.1 baseplate J/gp47 family protein [Lactobacillus gasseri]MCZ3538970.1 baseplate J/gp47 family protein [Lactobacillus gasseri]MCZ3546161.1 baseplate J/gp47 family protein [Lactobacillus gasseri]
MSPNELITEFQNEDYDYFLRKMLDAVPDNIDKREGSIIYDALAPAALVMGQQSLDMANVIKETYIKTASGEFLDYRAIEHGTSRYPATQTEAKAKVLNDKKEPLDNVQIGDKFASIGDSPIFYAVTKINDDLTVELTAEVKGSSANSYIGQILPVTPNDLLSWAEITEITAPARDVESDDHLRARLLSSQSWIAYGGNVADYLDMTSKIDEVGAAQIYPTWNGGGTVKVVILNNDLMPASASLVQKVKNTLDPEDKQAEGYGLAPIDHAVTVTAPEELIVNVDISVKLDDTKVTRYVKDSITKAVEGYFQSLRKDWADINQKLGRGYQETIYRSKILSQVMLTEGVVNAKLPSLNGRDADIDLVFTNSKSQLPVVGTVTINEQ